MKIQKGTIIRIPYFVVHHNPEYWPDPEVFNPERFLNEEAHDIKPFTWIPFGSGPRQCIGKCIKLGIYQIQCMEIWPHSL